jgi:hypothetical protein
MTKMVQRFAGFLIKDVEVGEGLRRPVFLWLPRRLWKRGDLYLGWVKTRKLAWLRKAWRVQTCQGTAYEL